MEKKQHKYVVEDVLGFIPPTQQQSEPGLLYFSCWKNIISFISFNILQNDKHYITLFEGDIHETKTW